MTVYKQLNGVIPVDKQLSETNSWKALWQYTNS
jgi:hypothetical protein